MPDNAAEKPVFMQSGILLVDKAPGWTSHDVVNFIRRAFNIRKAGHCGTLDPRATGLLVILIGQATKMSQELTGSDKTYEASIIFGIETDSQDMDGKIISEKGCAGLSETRIREVFSRYIGEMEQIPPMFSASKRSGKKLYELARQGIEIERDPKKITLHSLTVDKIYPPYTDFTLKCSKGTYVRTLCRDIGKELACGAALYKLRRTESGNFKIKDARSIEEVRAWTQDDLRKALVNIH
jgi:tRNA pseudouridine55 synthase